MFRAGGSVAELDTNLPVLLFRTNHYPLHHGTLAAVRSLGRAGIEVHALLEGRANPASRSRYLRGSHALGPCPADALALLRHLARVAERIDSPALLIPMDDAAALFAAERRPALESYFHMPEMSRSPGDVADKSQLLATCLDEGIPVPPSLVVSAPEMTKAELGALGFPLIAKWSRPWMLPPGAPSTRMVANHREVATMLFLSSAPGYRAAGPVIFQKIIGDTRHDWFFQGYFDHESNLVFGGVGRKRLAYPRKTGATVVGEWLPNTRLERHVLTLVKRLRYTGPADLDFRYDQQNDAYSLLDYNPRLGAQFRLFTDRQGTDLIRVTHLLGSGRPVPPAQPVFGRKLLVENRYLPLMARTPSHGFAALHECELAWLATDDLAPMSTLVRQSLRVAAGKAARRIAKAEGVSRYFTPIPNASPGMPDRSDSSSAAGSAADVAP
ncbi:carboxylate--amine ligase [Actinomadura rupiterrae]|uniref:carboxylate--amine ligase n=1 Tax=Actinomadura rupiterrae TaxID=559627 RepID=UPI0020A602A7|nr:ATP-grasp domain-containing protein [Actinomadura rupiterrae]MCP2335162.1 putative ATP-grasp superfamily ATP-dependent carboligase [Actinomadura rupiterrae]